MKWMKKREPVDQPASQRQRRRNQTAGGENQPNEENVL
jgi:hypothetical protein